MKTRIIKEVRALLPAWGLMVLVLCVITPRLVTGETNWSVWVCWAVAGSALMSIITFGHEFAHKTMPLLLAQGVSRWRVWNEKMGVLAAALVSVTGFGIIALWQCGADFDSSYGRLFLNFFWLIPLAALGSGPFWTLIARSGLGGLVFTFVVPCLLTGLAVAVSERFFLSLLRDTSNDSLISRLILFGLTGYSVLLHLWAWWMFRELELADGLNEEIKLPREMGDGLARLFDRLWFGGRSATAVLVKKEIRLQKLAWYMSAVLLLALLLLGLIRTGWPEMSETFFIAAIFIYAISYPVVLGAVSTAEEKNIGLLEWHLTLPVSRCRQWVVKCGAVWLMSFVMGLVFPWVSYWCLGKLGVNLPDLETRWVPILMVIAMQFIVLGIAMYASTLSQNTVRALILTFALIIGIFGGMGMAMHHGEVFMRHEMVSYSLDVRAVYWWQPFLPHVILSLVLAGLIASGLALWRLAYSNYRVSDLQPRRLRWHALLALAVMVLWVVVTVILDRLTLITA